MPPWPILSTCDHGQGVALSQQAHACTKFYHCFPSFSTVNDRGILARVLRPAGRWVTKWKIDPGEGKQTASRIIPWIARFGCDESFQGCRSSDVQRSFEHNSGLASADGRLRHAVLCEAREELLKTQCATRADLGAPPSGDISCQSTSWLRGGPPTLCPPLAPTTTRPEHEPRCKATSTPNGEAKATEVVHPVL